MTRLVLRSRESFGEKTDNRVQEERFKIKETIVIIM